jgi:hypothetical protein
MGQHLKSLPRLSRRQAHEMILAFAKHSDGGLRIVPPPSDQRVKQLLAARGVRFHEFVESVRDWPTHVPFFENLLDASDWEIVGGATVSFPSQPASSAVTGPGHITISTALSSFRLACEARERSVEHDSHAEYLAAATLGVAAIESFIRERANEWNASHAETPLLDSRSNKVPFDDKLKSWVPTMCAGRRLDLSGHMWRQFVATRRLRDDAVVHSKQTSQAISFKDLADLVNSFRGGVGRMMMELYATFEMPVPARVIRAAFAPDVEA